MSPAKCECPRVLPIADVCRWLLLLLSPLLSVGLAPGSHAGVPADRTRTISLGICVIRAFTRPELRGGLSGSNRDIPAVAEVDGTAIVASDRPHRAGDGPRPVRAGSAWPLTSDRSARSGLQGQARLRVYIDWCFSSCAGCPACTVALGAGGAGTYTERAISGPDLMDQVPSASWLTCAHPVRGPPGRGQGQAHSQHSGPSPHLTSMQTLFIARVAVWVSELGVL
jgi:hypothetical protein